MGKSKLDQRRINFVKSLPYKTRARILYEYLKKGTSNRDIERNVDGLNENDGWEAWSVIHFYGHNRFSKAQYPHITLKYLTDILSEISDEDLEEFHLKNDEVVKSQTLMNENDGKDVLRTITTRQGQYKLRQILLKSYKSRCAICDINHPKLLITSHIKTWAESTQYERINPSNCILLCSLHDALFEHGFISFDDNYKVLFSPNFDFKGQGIETNLNFERPLHDPPSKFFLQEHRLKHGFQKVKSFETINL
ncbi:MAG TPA: HNH endonuclease [Cerasibacillus sp.]|uniref:HNH endonuclease n=1 Tax=Cerasibacillus sp. TaxID=2498711 RepID=UPI002F407B6D